MFGGLATKHNALCSIIVKHNDKLCQSPHPHRLTHFCVLAGGGVFLLVLICGLQAQLTWNNIMALVNKHIFICYTISIIKGPKDAIL